MKLGLVVEGFADGAVCAIAARRLISGVNVHEPTVMINRPKLLSGCGSAAAALLEFGKCHKVLIVWDLHPNWADKKFKPCRHTDKQRALASIKSAGLDADPRVVLVCISRELETWLIADTAALTTVLAKYNSPDRIENINLPGKPERHPDPKGWLEDKFAQNARGTKYLDRDHGPALMSAVRDLKALKGIESFKRFAERVSGKKWPAQ